MSPLPNPLTPRRLPADVTVKPGDRRRLRAILLGVAIAFGGCLVLASGPSREANARLEAELAAVEAASCELSDDRTPPTATIEFTNTLHEDADYIVIDFEYLDVDGIRIHTGTVALAGLALNQTGSTIAETTDGPPELITAVSCEVTSAFAL